MELGASTADALCWTAGTDVYRSGKAASLAFANRSADDDVTTDAVLLANDLDILLQSNFAKALGCSTREFEAQNAGNFCYVKLFSVVETRQGVDRRRVIAWPKSINTAERQIALTSTRSSSQRSISILRQKFETEARPTRSPPPSISKSFTNNLSCSLSSSGCSNTTARCTSSRASLQEPYNPHSQHKLSAALC